MTPHPLDLGWYQDRENPERLRYWDGTSWTSESRPLPMWADRAIDLEVSERDTVASMFEGPAWYRPVPAPATSGASLRQRLSRSRGSAPPPRRPNSRRPSHPAMTQEQVIVEVAASRRPLLFLASLAFLAFGLVALTVIVTRPPASPPTSARPTTFVAQVNQQCEQILPLVHGPLDSANDGPSMQAAAGRVDSLRERLSQLSPGPLAAAGFQQWLQQWHRFAQDEQRYGQIIGPAVTLDSARRQRRLGRLDRQRATALSQGALESGATADRLAAGLGFSSCTLLGGQPSTSS